MKREEEETCDADWFRHRDKEVLRGLVAVENE